MTDTAHLLLDGYDRVAGVVRSVLDGIALDALTFRIDPDANTIAWLVWHLARVQDDHLAGAFDREQVYTDDSWFERLALPFEATAIGYGQSTEEVGLVRAGADELLGYFEAVHRRSRQLLAGLTDDDLDRVVDEDWDPPVTLGVRLTSVLSDDLQHAGQAAFIRGVADRSSPAA